MPSNSINPDNKPVPKRADRAQRRQARQFDPTELNTQLQKLGDAEQLKGSQQPPLRMARQADSIPKDSPRVRKFKGLKPAIITNKAGQRLFGGKREILEGNAYDHLDKTFLKPNNYHKLYDPPGDGNCFISSFIVFLAAEIHNKAKSQDSILSDMIMSYLNTPWQELKELKIDNKSLVKSLGLTEREWSKTSKELLGALIAGDDPTKVLLNKQDHENKYRQTGRVGRMLFILILQSQSEKKDNNRLIIKELASDIDPTGKKGEAGYVGDEAADALSDALGISIPAIIVAEPSIPDFTRVNKHSLKKQNHGLLLLQNHYMYISK